MEQLIKTLVQVDGSTAVDGRDLYDFLEVETKYTDWMQRMIEYGFAENVDFSVFLKNEQDATAFGGIRKIKDHALTVDMAKELSMIQRTEKGKQARQYFLQMERIAKEHAQYQIPKTLGDALQLAADQTKKLEKQKPKVDYYDAQMRNPGLLTTTIIAKEYGKSAIWLNKYLVKRGVLYRQGKNLVLKKKYDDESYASYENWSDDEHKHVHPLLKWTQRGKKFIYDLLAADGILPNVETMLTE